MFWYPVGPLLYYIMTAELSSLKSLFGKGSPVRQAALAFAPIVMPHPMDMGATINGRLKLICNHGNLW